MKIKKLKEIMKMILKNKFAVVTGAKGNLGPVWVRTLENAGAKVVKIDLPDCDISDENAVRHTVTRVINEHGVPNILINNAAIDNPPGSLASFFGNSDQIIAVNLLGTACVVKHFISEMAGNGGGNIVNIGSMLGFIASNPAMYDGDFDKPWAYGASKAALWNFTNNCNARYGKYGVVSTMLALSAVEGAQGEAFKERYKEKIPIKRMLRTEDFTNEFLCCAQARVPYDAPLFVGGGYTII